MVAARLVSSPDEDRVEGRVLVVDDDASLRTSLQVRLRMEGIQVVEAIDGLEALEKLASEVVDVVLTDVDMPRLNGFGLLERMREDPDYRMIPVIVMTAHARQAEEAAFGLELGASDYVRKPFDWLELTARVRTQLRVRQAHRLSVEKQRDLAIIELAGAAAHEINNPLAVGFARLELMMSEADGNDGLLTDLRQVEGLMERIADVVKKMNHVRHYQAENYCGGVNILDLDASGE
jgi:two-component system cell cycle response regulator